MSDIFEQGDEAIDEESRLDPSFTEELEQDPSLDPTLEADDRELEEAGAKLDDPPGSTGHDIGAGAADANGWDLAAPLTRDDEDDEDEDDADDFE